LVSPSVASLCQYETETIALIATRDIQTLQEIDIALIANINRWRLPKEISFQWPTQFHDEYIDSIASLFNMACDLNPILSAGFVALDSSFQRISINSPQHEGLLALREENTVFWSADTNTNEKIVFEIVRTNDILIWNEKLSKQLFLAEEWLKYYQESKKRHDSFITYVEEISNKLQKEEDQSVVAKEAKKYPFYGVLFEGKGRGIPNLRKYFAICQFSKYFKLLKKTEQFRESKPIK